MRDLVKLIEGIQEYVRKAIAPVAERLRQFEEATATTIVGLNGAVGDLTKRMTECEGFDERLKATIEDERGEKALAREWVDGITARVESLEIARLSAPLPEDAIKSAFAGEFAAAVEDGVAISRAQAEAMVDAVRSAIPEIPEPIEPPAQRTDDEIKRLAQEAIALNRFADADFVAREFAAIRASLPDVPALVDMTLALMPKPEKGEDGKSITTDDVRPMVAQVVEQAMETFAARCEAAIAKAALEFERRAQDALAKAVADLPKPKDGVDGLGFEDIQFEHDGERKAAFVLSRDDRVKRFDFRLHQIIDRGFYVAGQAYEKGDGVTCGGRYWIAQEDTDLRPGEGTAWRVAVNKGRDARSIPIGEPKKVSAVRLSGANE